jgi:competence protein ComEC
LGTLARRNIPFQVITTGDILDFGEVSIEVLNPQADSDADAIYDNDHSLVLRIIYGSRVFLLTGDIEKGSENALLENGVNLSADVVKAAHHGSRTSSTSGFVNATGAEVVIFSVGRSSPFGHPHPDIVERWRASGAKVMTTGERGMVSISTNGSDLYISTFVP